MTTKFDIGQHVIPRNGIEHFVKEISIDEKRHVLYLCQMVGKPYMCRFYEQELVEA